MSPWSVVSPLYFSGGKDMMSSPLGQHDDITTDRPAWSPSLTAHATPDKRAPRACCCSREQHLLMALPARKEILVCSSIDADVPHKQRSERGSAYECAEQIAQEYQEYGIQYVLFQFSM